MSLRLSLDNVLVKEHPQGLNDLKGSIKYDRNLKGRFLTEDQVLVFYEDGYRHLKKLDSQGFCAEVAVRIEEDVNEDSAFEVIYDGIIHLPACEFGIEPYYVRCPVDDNNFYARINKNKSIKVLITTDRSKNDLPITPAAHEVVEFFRPSTGAYSYPNRWVYPAREVFRVLIEWMSDGEVGFVSDTFADGTGDYEDLGVILGAELRAGPANSHDKQPEISFQEYLEQVNKKYNLQIGIEYSSAGKPVIRIEKEDSFYSSDISVQIDYVHDIKQKVDASRLYAAIKAGSDKTDDSSGAVQYPETTRWLTFRSEQYPSLGQCNIDTELDLVSSYIISSNVIEQIVVNNLPDYDDDIVLVQVDFATLKAKQSNWLTAGPPYFYNEGLKNDAVVQRWLSGIPASIANYLGTNNDARFNARLDTTLNFDESVAAGGSTGAPVWGRNDFSNTGFDAPGNNYGGGTAQGTIVPFNKAKYTAPQGGFYRFGTGLYGQILHHSFGSACNFWVKAMRFNAANALITQLNYFFSIPPGITSPVNFDHHVQFSFLLNSTDFVKVEWRVSNQNINDPSLRLVFNSLPDSYFRCDFTSFGGGVWATVDDADFKCVQFTFKAAMSKQTFDRIKSRMSEAIYFNTDGIKNYKAWIDQISCNKKEGNATLTLITSHRLKP